MKTIIRGNLNVARIAFAIGTLVLIFGYIGYLMLSDESKIKPILMPCAILLSYPLSRFRYQKWIIDDSYSSISYSSHFSTSEISLENISQIIPRGKYSFRIFYNDGSDKNLDLSGLPKDMLDRINLKLGIEPAVRAYRCTQPHTERTLR